MYSITKEFSFEYSHRLNMNYESACKNLHGHSAKVIVTVWSKQLNEHKMIVDFTHLKPVKEWLDNNLDHCLILNGADPLSNIPEIKEMKTFILQNGVDPSSEVMARIIWDKVAVILNDLTVDWEKLAITFYETTKNYATYEHKFERI